MEVFFSEKGLFKSITVSPLTSFQTDNNNCGSSKLYHAKISFSGTPYKIVDLWEVFVKDILKNIDNQYGFHNIKYITSFKIAILFEFDIIENHGFISGKLIHVEYDKYSKLIFLPHIK